VTPGPRPTFGTEQQKRALAASEVHGKCTCSLVIAAEDITIAAVKIVAEGMVTVNNRSLNSLFKSDWEDAKNKGEGLEFSLPGIQPAQLFEKFKIKTLILGKKGTHFLVDTTTLHRAKPVVQGERKVVVISFNRASLI
jgi:hypothetical protein